MIPWDSPLWCIPLAHDDRLLLTVIYNIMVNHNVTINGIWFTMRSRPTKPGFPFSCLWFWLIDVDCELLLSIAIMRLSIQPLTDESNLLWPFARANTSIIGGAYHWVAGCDICYWFNNDIDLSITSITNDQLLVISFSIRHYIGLPSSKLSGKWENSRF